LPIAIADHDDRRAAAVIDIGSNTAQLLVVATNSTTPWKELERRRYALRLGADVAVHGRLSADALARCVLAVAEMVAAAQRHAASPIIVATSAVRDAANGAELVERVAAACGMHVHVLGPNDEAHFGYRGAVAAVDALAANHVAVDIGGNSTEVVTPVLGTAVAAPQALLTDSLALGAVRQTAQNWVEGTEPLDRDAVVAAWSAIDSIWATCTVPGRSVDALVLSGGLASTLRSIAAAGGVDPMHRVDEGWVRALCDEIISHADVRWNSSVPGMPPDRADIIIAGSMILLGALNRWPSQRVELSAGGLKEGVLAAHLSDGAPGSWPALQLRRRRR
jgi:exopolyphosphatase / guanosine-5'-triphosphate,3'-diphosphate pyrophosphatase